MSDVEKIGPIDMPKPNSEMPNEFKERQYIRIYIASALTGRQEEKDIDKNVREAIREVFLKASCQVGPYVIKYKVYDPAEHTFPGSSHRSEEVYHIDYKELVGSDLAIFYINATSFGVGMERQIAATGSVPAVWICQDGNEISRMFRGVFGVSLFAVQFTCEEEMKLKLANEIAKFGPEIVAMARKRRRVISDMRVNELPAIIFKRRMFLGIGIEEMARETGIAAYWWTQLERDTSAIIAGTMLTPILLSQISELLQAGYSFSETGLPRLNPDDNMGKVVNKSLQNLHSAHVHRKKVTDDDVLLEVCKTAVEMLQQNNEPLLNDPVSEDEWLMRIGEREKAYYKEREKDRLVQVLKLNIKELTKTDSRSLGNLSEFLAEINRLSDQTIIRLWKQYKKNVKKKGAARTPSSVEQSNLLQYSVEDWRNLFNQLHLND